MTRHHPIRVLLISPRYRAGGAERAAADLLNHLPAVGALPTMYTAVPEPDVPDNVVCIRTWLERLGYPLNRLPTINDWRHVGSRRALARVSASQFDLIHLHNLHGDWLSFRAVAALSRRMPTVWTLHDEWATTGGMPYDITRVVSADEARRLARAANLPSRYPIHPGRWATRWKGFLQHHMPRPNALITPSKWLAEQVTESSAFRGTPVHRIPYGIDLLDSPHRHAPRTEARRRWSLQPDSATVLLIAADLASPFKGMPLAVNVLTQLAESDTEFAVLLLGRGGDELANRLRRSTGRVIVTGFASSSDELALAYRAASVMLVPSIADNFPYVLLEAAACGTPSVAFRVGGVPEIVTPSDDSPHGVIAAPADTTAAAVSLRKLLLDPATGEAMGDAAARWASEQVNMNHYVNSVMDVYRSVASTPST